MQSIDVQTVREAVREALERRHGRRLSLAVLDAVQPRRRPMDVSA
jgi:hypothetical protein